MYYRQEKSTLVNGKNPIPKIVKTAPNGTVSEAGNDNHTKKQERGKPFRQIMAAFVANIGTINTGLIFGFSAIAVPQLEQPDSTIPIDEYQASWIGE